MSDNEGLIVDLFAGGGGASMGIEAAMGRHVDIAINHDPIAIAVHLANHPKTTHYTTDIWDVKPLQATQGRRVRLLHASPDCKHFSRAKGGKPGSKKAKRSSKVRSLAWVVRRWAKDTKPDVITLENVAEFQDWGPLYPEHTLRHDVTNTVRTFASDELLLQFQKQTRDARWRDVSESPIPERKGETFKRWCRDLKQLGYKIEFRLLKACDYGAPTSRKRLFLVARCDGGAIGWPEPTHGPGRAKPYNTAAQCIDFAHLGQSIFGRKKPLAEKTLKRIAAGVVRFVLSNARPFIIPVNAARRGHALVVPFVAGCGGRAGQTPPTGGDQPIGTITTKNDHVLVAPTLIQTGYGEREGQAPRVLNIHEPLGTLMGQGQKHAMAAAMLKHFGGVVGHEVDKPIGTITAIDHHSLLMAQLSTEAEKNAASILPFLSTYYGSLKDVGQVVGEPLRTVVTKDRFALVSVVVDGVTYVITDILMRMLEPDELDRAQYGRFAHGFDTTPAKTKKDRVRLTGNSVCPELEEALVGAQFPERATRARASA